MYKILKGRTWKNSLGISVDNFAKSVSFFTTWESSLINNLKLSRLEYVF